MQLHDYIVVVRKRWVSILLTMALAVAGAVGATLLTTPVYEASTQVFVSSGSAGTTADLIQGSDFARQRVTSYTTMVVSPRVLEPVIEKLGLDVSAAQLARSITADSPLDTVLINITVTNPDPQVAADVANATSDSLGTQVAILDKPAGRAPSPVHVSFLRTATVPTEPTSPNLTFNLALGLLLGLTLGFMLAILREILDTKVRSETDIRKVTDASVLARIHFDQDAPQHPLIVQSSPNSHRSEAFRRLRTNLQFLDLADRPKAIVVTSSLPGEGKSTTAINLAITLADAGSRVALIDADLRRPSIAEYMGLEGEVGLTTVLIGQADVQDAIQPWGKSNLHVLPSGQVPPNPSELLGSRAMASLLEQLAGRYDLVLIDTPPLLPVTDAAILAKVTGGALVVAGADTLHRQQLADGLGSLHDVGARVLGVVLNRLASKETDAFSYYDYAAISGAAAQSRAKSSRKGVGRAKGRGLVKGKGLGLAVGLKRHRRPPAAGSESARARPTHAGVRGSSSQPGGDVAAQTDREPVRVSSAPEDAS